MTQNSKYMGKTSEAVHLQCSHVIPSKISKNKYFANAALNYSPQTHSLDQKSLLNVTWTKLGNLSFLKLKLGLY